MGARRRTVSVSEAGIRGRRDRGNVRSIAQFPACYSPLSSVAAAGCEGNDQSTLDPGGTDARDIATLWWVMFVGSVVVFAVVLVLVAVVLLRRRGLRAIRRICGHVGAPTWIPVVGGIVIPTVVLAGLFALTLGTLSSTSPAASSATALTVDVTGRQWFWDVTYPSAHVRTANEIHIPVGVPVRRRGLER